MLVQFSQGQWINERGKAMDMVVAINPIDVSSVQRAREHDWSVVVMRNGREHTVTGTVLDVIEKLNRVEFLATMDQGETS